jgi:hypothetical protein
MKQKILNLFLIAIIGSQVACASMSSLQTAEVLEPGKTQQTFGGGYYASEETSNNVSLSTKLPYLEYSYREGVTKDFDAGVKLTIIGAAAVDGKYRLYDGEKFDFAIGGALGYMSIKTGSGATETENTIIDLMVPVYASYRFSDQWAAYLTPRYVLRMNSRSGSDGGSSSGSLIGGAGGLKIGKEWGAYVEAAYQKETGTTFDLMQYNVSFFWEADGGVLAGIF